MPPIEIKKIDYQIELTDAVKQSYPNSTPVNLLIQNLLNVPELKNNEGRFLVINQDGTAIEFIELSQDGSGTPLTKAQILNLLGRLSDDEITDLLGMIESGGGGGVTLRSRAETLQLLTSLTNAEKDILNIPTQFVERLRTRNEIIQLLMSLTNAEKMTLGINPQTEPPVDPPTDPTTYTLTYGNSATAGGIISNRMTSELELNKKKTIPISVPDNNFLIFELPTGRSLTGFFDANFPSTNTISLFTKVGQRWSLQLTEINNQNFIVEIS